MRPLSIPPESTKALLRNQRGRYDLAILDIMGVDGLTLLEEAVERGIPTVMLTAHAISPETLMESIQKGAISYLPKETLADLNDLLNDLLGAFNRGEPPWKLLFERLGDFFDRRFGSRMEGKRQRILVRVQSQLSDWKRHSRASQARQENHR